MIINRILIYRGDFENIVSLVILLNELKLKIILLNYFRKAAKFFQKNYEKFAKIIMPNQK